MSSVSYLDFLSSVLLFRTVRDMDDFPETWLEREIASVRAGDCWTAEETEELILTAKVTDLFDGSKKWLLDEISEDIYRIINPGCKEAEIEFPDPGYGWDWWLNEFTYRDDMGDYFGLSFDNNTKMISLSGSIKAEDTETANRTLRRRVEWFLQSELPVAA